MLQRLIISGLIFGLVSVVSVPIARAEMNDNSYATASMSDYSLKPFNLVTLGYQGYFQAQGIPSNGSFLSGIHGGQITAKKLIESAIAKGRLPETAKNDTAYLKHVENQLMFFIRN